MFIKNNRANSLNDDQDKASKPASPRRSKNRFRQISQSRNSSISSVSSQSVNPALKYSQGGMYVISGKNGVTVRRGLALTSKKIGHFSFGTKIQAKFSINNRLKIIDPMQGWISYKNKQGYILAKQLNNESIQQLNSASIIDIVEQNQEKLREKDKEKRRKIKLIEKAMTTHTNIENVDDQSNLDIYMERDDDIREVTKFHVAFDGDRARVHARSVIFDKDQNASLRSIVAEIELEDENPSINNVQSKFDDLKRHAEIGNQTINKLEEKPMVLNHDQLQRFLSEKLPSLERAPSDDEINCFDGKLYTESLRTITSHEFFENDETSKFDEFDFPDFVSTTNNNKRDWPHVASPSYDTSDEEFENEDCSAYDGWKILQQDTEVTDLSNLISSPSIFLTRGEAVYVKRVRTFQFEITEEETETEEEIRVYITKPVKGWIYATSFEPENNDSLISDGDDNFCFANDRRMSSSRNNSPIIEPLQLNATITTAAGYHQNKTNHINSPVFPLLASSRSVPNLYNKNEFLKCRSKMSFGQYYQPSYDEDDEASSAIFE